MKKLTKKAPLTRLRQYLKINFLFFLNIFFSAYTDDSEKISTTFTINTTVITWNNSAYSYLLFAYFFLTPAVSITFLFVLPNITKYWRVSWNCVCLYLHFLSRQLRSKGICVTCQELPYWISCSFQKELLCVCSCTFVGWRGLISLLCNHIGWLLRSVLYWLLSRNRDYKNECKEVTILMELVLVKV